jgi:transcriptional regulator with XRE-family HTH domain
MTSPSRTPGRALTALLKSRGDPTGVAMARKLKVTPMTVYRWRNSEDMALSRVMQLANYFNLTVDQFLSWEEGNESGNSNLESYVEETDHGA